MDDRPFTRDHEVSRLMFLTFIRRYLTRFDHGILTRDHEVIGLMLLLLSGGISHGVDHGKLTIEYAD